MLKNPESRAALPQEKTGADDLESIEKMDSLDKCSRHIWIFWTIYYHMRVL